MRGSRGPAVLKVGMPHMEARDEIAALQLLNGDPSVRLYESDLSLNAMLIERCDPGTSLRGMFQPDQDVVIANLLKRFWRAPRNPHPFRNLSVMITHWIDETRASEPRWRDRELVQSGIDVLERLCRDSISNTLLATDLHAGNVLRSQRAAWLVIDPKPFVGDRAYDTTQHLMNCRDRMESDPSGTMRRIADLLEVEYGRVRLWMFARLAAEPRDHWDDWRSSLARSLRM
jgi:streptomycin 6-kinase